MLLSVTPEGATGNDLLVIVQNANILVDGDEGGVFLIWKLLFYLNLKCFEKKLYVTFL